MFKNARKETPFVYRQRVLVGASYHQEFWIPAEDLAEFNGHIIGKIEVI